MAIYHLHSSVGRRKTGQSARAKSEYLARQGRYKRGSDQVRHVESGNMPAWAWAGRGADRAARYWRNADQHERANAILFREVEAALPRELDEQQQLDLARNLAEAAASSEAGALPYTLAVHDSGTGNPHVHVMISERVVDGHDRDPEGWFKRGDKKNPERGGAPKAGIGEYRKRWLAGVREQWADLANKALERAGEADRVDHRSLAAQGIDRLAQRHFGAKAAAIEKRTGEVTVRGELYRARLYAIEHPHDGVVRGEYERALDQQQIRVRVKGGEIKPVAPLDYERRALAVEQDEIALSNQQAQKEYALEETPRYRVSARKRLADSLRAIGQQIEQVQHRLHRLRDAAESLRQRLRKSPRAVRRAAAAADEAIAQHRAYQRAREQPQDAAAAPAPALDHGSPGDERQGHDFDPTPTDSPASPNGDMPAEDPAPSGHDDEDDEPHHGPMM